MFPFLRLNSMFYGYLINFERTMLSEFLAGKPRVTRKSEFLKSRMRLKFLFLFGVSKNLSTGSGTPV